ncbi:hypothetical protein MKX03_024608, partial [Papaver bracteatum]
MHLRVFPAFPIKSLCRIKTPSVPPVTQKVASSARQNNSKRSCVIAVRVTPKLSTLLTHIADVIGPSVVEVRE